MTERLQKLLAQANIASRRVAEEYITAGRVRVNGGVAKLGDKADPETDVIEVDGVRLKFEAAPHIYIMLNKPKQVLSTDKPHRGDKRETVSDLLGRNEHLFSIGRLDADSEGLVVMTNDGDLAEKLSHPRYRHTKTYRVEVLGLPTAETLEKWQRGVTLEDGLTAPCHVEITQGSVKGTTVLRIVMTEGKKRQIRRVASLLGHPVRRLTRTHIGMLALGSLEPGQSRELTPKEVLALKTPSPEIKALRAQPRRRPATPEQAGADMEAAPRRAPRRRSDESGEPERRRPTRDEASADRRARRVRTADTPASAADERPRRRSTRPQADGASEAPRRHSPARPVRDEADERPRRRSPARPVRDEADERPRRRTVRSQADQADDQPRPRSRSGSKPAEPPKDTDVKPRAPRARKPESGSSGGSDTGAAKRRPPKPFAPFKSRNQRSSRKPGSGKDRR